MPDDEAGKRTAYVNEVPGREARATLGDRFYRGKTRSMVSDLGCTATMYAKPLQKSKKGPKKNGR